MIEFCHISKSFRTDFWARPINALTDVSFQLSSKEVTGFLGANGSGKTTTLKILMHFISASAGEVVYAPELGKTFLEIVSNIGYMPERPYFYSNLTGREFLFYMGSLNEVKMPLLRERVSRWGERLQIAHALDRKINNYSKGMLQRLGLVSILLHGPQLLILDEPLSGVDPIGRKEMKAALDEIHKEGKTIFFSSHIVPDIEEICTSVVVLEEGKVRYSGPVDALLGRNSNKKEGPSLEDMVYKLGKLP